MIKLYSPDKMVGTSIFSCESQLAKNDGSKVVARHSTVAASKAITLCALLASEIKKYRFYFLRVVTRKD